MDLEYRGMLWSPTVLVVRLVALVNRLTIHLCGKCFISEKLMCLLFDKNVLRKRGRNWLE